MPKKFSWDKLPKFVQSLIVTLTLVIIALVVTLLLFDTAKDSGFMDYKTEKMAFFVSGAIAVFILVFMVLSKEFRKISAVLTIIGIVGLTSVYVFKTDYSRSMYPISDNEREPYMKLREELQEVKKEKRQTISKMESQIKQYERTNQDLEKDKRELTVSLQEVREESVPVARFHQLQGRLDNYKMENQRLATELEGKIEQYNAERRDWNNEREELHKIIKRYERTLEQTDRRIEDFNEDGVFCVSFPLSPSEKQFLKDLVNIDNEYKRRNNRELLPEYMEKAREAYSATHR